MPIYELPPAFEQTVRSVFPAGKMWLESLPDRIAACEARWRVRLGPPFTLSYNYVAPATSADGTELVVKLGVPNPGLRLEIGALRCYSGNAAVRLVDFDQELGWLLLERLLPGKMLASVEDQSEATEFAAALMRDLPKPLPAAHTFPNVSDWVDGFRRLRIRFNGGTGPLPSRMLDMGESLFDDLLSSSETPVLLHGDLHHFNILSSSRKPWVVIDPKGVAGEPAYETGAWLRNPNSRICTDARIQKRRIDIFSAELSLDSERIAAWGVAQSVLSGLWSYEDGESGWEQAFACAEVLASLMS